MHTVEQFRRSVTRFAACASFVSMASVGVAAYTPVTHTWVGGDSAGPFEWTVAANWNTGVVPTNAADTCVFDKGAGYTNTITRSTACGRLPSITVLSGCISLSGNLTLPKSDNSQEKAYTPNNYVTNVFHVAQGAMLKTLTVIWPHRDAPYAPARGVRKTGGGTWLHPNAVAIGDSNGNWNLYVVEVVEGLVQIQVQIPYIQNVVVRNGGTYCTTTDRSVWEKTVFAPDKGGRVMISAYNGNNAQAQGLRGEGDFIAATGYDNNQIRLNLNNGPYRFAGRVYSTYTKPVIFKTGIKGTGQFVICASNTLAGTAGNGVISYNPQVSPVWGRGVGEFWSMPILGKAGVPVPTEDEDGERITLHASIDAATAVTGSGNWYAGSAQSTTITGAQVSVTGTIGVDKGSTLVLGNGTDAAADVDLTQYAGLVANGSVTFQNVGSQTIASAFAVGEKLAVNGPVTFSSGVTAGSDVTTGAAATFGGNVTAGGKVTFGGSTTVTGDLKATGAATFNGATTIGGDTKVGSISVKAPTTLGHLDASEISGMAADLTVKSGEIRGNLNIGAGTLTLENALVVRNYGARPPYDGVYTAGRPAGVRIDGSAATSRLVVGAGSDVYAYQNLNSGASLAMPSFTVKDGGRLTFQYPVWGNNAAESALTATLDGGTIGLSSWYSQYGFTFPNDAAKWTLKVGAKGGVFENTAAHSNGLRYSLRYHDYLAAESGVASGKDGGLTFAVQGVFNINKPQRITGPLVVKDGLVRFYSGAFIDGNAISLGSVVLDGGVMVLDQDITTDIQPVYAQAAGSEFVYRGAACLELGEFNVGENFAVHTPAQTYTIGPAGATASSLVRGGKGSVLRLSDRVNTVAIGSANGGKVFVNGGVETNKNGLVLAPVFASRRSVMNFLKYDAANGFTEFADADYATSLDAGSDKVVKIANTKTTLSSDATIMGLRLDYAKNKPLTIDAGATLTVGDGVHPAAIILNTVYNGDTSFWTAINGAGAIDFGTSEGLLVKPFRSHSDYDAPPIVSAKIHGQNGLTVVGDNCGENPVLELSGANDYTGGTFIDMIEVQGSGDSPFGAGLVTVRGRRLNGGAAAFNSAKTYANDFVITGYGKNYNCGGSNYARGALHFRWNGTRLEGDVRVDEYARISSYDAPANAVNTIAGDITGGDLQFYSGASTGKKIVLEGHNTLTGKVEILAADIVLKGDTASLGTGEVLVDAGVLEFENTTDITFPNDLRGNGAIKLNGADVSFTGDTNVDGANALYVDLAGCAPTLKNMPPFATITNFAAKAANVTLAADMTVSPSAYAYLTPNVNLTVADGATVTVPAGETLVVRRLTLVGSGRLVGNFKETNPRKGFVVIIN